MALEPVPSNLLAKTMAHVQVLLVHLYKFACHNRMKQLPCQGEFVLIAGNDTAKFSSA